MYSSFFTALSIFRLSNPTSPIVEPPNPSLQPLLTPISASHLPGRSPRNLLHLRHPPRARRRSGPRPLPSRANLQRLHAAHPRLLGTNRIHHHRPTPPASTSQEAYPPLNLHRGGLSGAAWDPGRDQMHDAFWVPGHAAIHLREGGGGVGEEGGEGD